MRPPSRRQAKEDLPRAGIRCDPDTRSRFDRMRAPRLRPTVKGAMAARALRVLAVAALVAAAFAIPGSSRAAATPTSETGSRSTSSGETNAATAPSSAPSSTSWPHGPKSILPRTRSGTTTPTAASSSASPRHTTSAWTACRPCSSRVARGSGTATHSERPSLRPSRNARQKAVPTSPAP